MGNGIFEKNYSLRASDFDTFLQIKASSILDLFQDVACIHAEKLGIGFNNMLEMGYMWVLLKVKFQIVKAPHMYQSVKVITWPKEAKRLDFERDYLILDENNEVLIKGTSQWAVIDKDTRKLTRAKDLYKNVDEFITDSVFVEKPIRVQSFDDGDFLETACARFSDIDSNKHVNNIRYADFAINAYAPKSPLNIKEMQIDFHKEIIEGEQFNIYIKQQEDSMLFKGTKDETLMFCIKIQQ